MLSRAHLHEAIRSGDVTLAFRRWKRRTVKPGGTITTPAGVLAIDAVDEISVADIDPADVHRAGHRSVDELLESVHDDSADRRLYRIRFHRAGDDPKIDLRDDVDIHAEDRTELDKRLAALDRASPTGPWT